MVCNVFIVLYFDVDAFLSYFQEYSGSKATLTVSNVTKDDSGTFVCTASNGIGEPTTKESHLIVKCE